MEPQDANGFEVATASQAIRANIQYLHQQLLGEFLSVNDPEIDRTYRLYLDLWQDGLSGMAAANPEDGPGEYPQGLGQCGATTDYWTGEDLGEKAVTDDSNYTIRAWMGVMSYLLQDYRFLHE
jgi:hypothetical protein